MIENWTDLSEFLTQNRVSGSTPTRLDCGGSTDHRLTGLVCRSWRPATANIAIDLRARVTLSPFKPGRIGVSIDGVGSSGFPVEELPFSGPYALVSAIACHFGIHGVKIDIHTEFPYQSGLGGSGSVSVALIGSICAALNQQVPKRRDFPRIAKIAHHLEDSLFSNTGMQDQAAALYGGANLWEWDYGDHLGFRRQQLANGRSSLDDHVLLAYTGRPHLQSQNGSQMLAKFKERAALGLFSELSAQARRFADSINDRNYRAAGECLAEEYRLRSTLVPVTDREDLELIKMGSAIGCGVSVTGRGGGGCIWAIGEKSDIADLRRLWSAVFERRGRGALLPAKVTKKGLDVKIENANEAEIG